MKTYEHLRYKALINVLHLAFNIKVEDFNGSISITKNGVTVATIQLRKL